MPSSRFFYILLQNNAKYSLGKRKWDLFHRSFFTSGLSRHLADRCAGRLKKGEGQLSTHAGTVTLLGGIVECRIMGGPGWRRGADWEDCTVEGTLERGLEA